MLGIIIQARMNSTRLPGKMAKKIQGKTVLEHVILRLKKIHPIKSAKGGALEAQFNRVNPIKSAEGGAKQFNRVKTPAKIILATTTKKADNILERIARKNKISVFRGSEDDVLDRFYQSAKKFKIDPIVRITADCPVLDGEVAEEAINFYLKNKNKFDYISNVRPPTYPDGLDVEVFSFASLEKSWQEAKLKSEREHVTPYITKHPETFKIGNITRKGKDLSALRLTLDEAADLILIRKVYNYLYPIKKFFTLSDILKLFSQKPELLKINQGIQRNEGFLKSLKNDKIYELARKK